MKDLKDLLNESLNINESKSLLNGIYVPDDDEADVKNVRDEISNSVENALAQLRKNNKPTKIKKMFADASNDELKDYVTIINYFCDYIEGVSNIIADEEDLEEIRMNTNMLVDVNELMEHTVDNMHNEYNSGDFKSENWETLVDNVSSNWNDVCKALTGAVWSD